MKITRVGLDLAKRVFQVHGVNEHGARKRSKRLSRGEVLEFPTIAAAAIRVVKVLRFQHCPYPRLIRGSRAIGMPHSDYYNCLA
jgi:hypothetical protein